MIMIMIMISMMIIIVMIIVIINTNDQTANITGDATKRIVDNQSWIITIGHFY